MIQHVKRKCPLIRNTFLLHHDNARPHVARCVLDVSQQNNVEILPHPPYSPDKSPCDFWLFPQLKKPLRGKRFASNKACVKATEILIQLSQNGLLHVFKKWTERWGAKKEDLRRIASELELCVSDKLTVIDLMDLIKNCDRYKNDPDSVHELANLIIEERKYDESQQLELEK
ncbi:histone-lysine N-methyltransferase SETMAR [Trichonephila clavipes]|nr:histone-lysine N-methyltransferase SETMAR [Trichonephila clavipes]